MDRREAMLRELNLYPLWVRREQPAPDVVSAPCVEVAADEQGAETHAPVAPVQEKDIVTGESNRLAGDIAPAHSTEAAAEDLFAAPPDNDFQPADYGQDEAGEDSLREFQLKIAGGPLADIAWPELRQKVRDCELCKLREGCRQTVFGSGDEQADWMFIGEAPGAEEDALGEPFTGQAGRLLDNMLLAIRLKRGDKVYIANVIKCRPEDDRHPHVGEVAACLPYLKRQVALIKPKLIVALGKTAASALLDTDTTIAALRGAVHDYSGIPLIVTYHPAYLLRSPMEKVKAWQDLCLAVDTMNGLAG